MKAFSVTELHCCTCLAPLEYLPMPEQREFKEGIALARHNTLYPGGRTCPSADKLYRLPVAQFDLTEVTDGTHNEDPAPAAGG